MTSSKTHAPVSFARIVQPKFAALLAVAVALSLQTPSQAVVIGKYSILVGESARYLKAIFDYNQDTIDDTKLAQIKSEESCKNPSIRLFDRNQPAILVQNTSDQDNELDSVVIDMQQEGYLFGLGDLARDFSGEVFIKSNQTSSGVTVSGDYNGSMQQLKINFTGLGPNEMALFRIDLDPDPNHDPVVSELYPDYRSVLLGADPGTGPTDPALISAVFSMVGMDDAQTEPVPLQGPDTVSHAGELEVYHAQTETDMFDTDGQVPEPSSLVLLGLSALGLSVRRR